MIILVADDDRLIRFMMKSMLNDILTSDYTLLEAANGRDMAKICREKTPDIVFADIKMPYMNGIEAIAECKKYSGDTEFVLISGYSEFAYAQQAIKLGVQDYLLKPVEEEQLRSVMEKLQSKIAGRKKESNSWFQLKLFNTFNYFSTIGTEEPYEYEEENFGEGMTYEVVGIKTRCPRQEQTFHMEFLKNIIDQMEILGKELVKRRNFYSQIYSPEGTLYFVFCTAPEGREEILAFVKKLGVKMKTTRLAFHFLYFSGNSMEAVYRQCERTDNSLGIEMNTPTGTIIDVCGTEISGNGTEVLYSVSKMIDAWENADAIAYTQILNQMYSRYKDEDIEKEVSLENISRYCTLMLGQDIDGATYKRFCKSFVDISESMYENVESTDSDVIEQVKAYVEKNYMNDIGIGQIAELFGITPNYLSTIFHQKAGCKFVDYLTEVRMANAKRLLIQNSTASVKDIAVMVGYNSSRYFATLFQKVTGKKPSVYRKERADC